MTKNKFRKDSKQQPLRGEMFKTLGKRKNPIWGDFAFYGGLGNPLETMSILYLHNLHEV